MTLRHLAAGSAARIFAAAVGPRPVLAPPDQPGAAAILERVTAHHGEVKGILDKQDEGLKGLGSRLTDVEQIWARMQNASLYRDGLGAQAKSWGQTFIESDGFKAFAATDAKRGDVRVQVPRADMQVKTITSATSGSGAAGGLVAPDIRTSPIMLPWNRLTIRDLVAPGSTISNSVSFPRQIARTNNAATVAENPSSPKPQSDFTTEEVTCPVRTVAHWFLASRQIMDDAPALASTIDREATNGLADAEDKQLLLGDGTGTNLLGLMTGGSNFAKQWTVTNGTPIDVLIQAIAQSEAQNYQVDGMVLNVVDWLQMIATKDTQGRYLSAGPFGGPYTRSLWDVPVAATNQVPQGTFLVGPFKTQAQIFDRMLANVLLSTEDSDNFRRNLVTILAEERLAFAIYRPTSFIKGNLATSLA